MIWENPRLEMGRCGRLPVHSKEKMGFACLVVMAGNHTYRDIKSDMQDIERLGTAIRSPVTQPWSGAR